MLSGVNVQASCHGALETESLQCDEWSRLDVRVDRKIIRWFRMHASRHCWQGLVDGSLMRRV